MLQKVGTLQPSRRKTSEAPRGTPSLGDLADVLRHQWRLMLGVLLLFVAGAALYVATADKYYTATTELLIEPRPEDPMQKQRPASDAQIETSTIESQAQLITSDAVVRSVVRALDLTHDPVFMQDDTPWFLRALGALTGLVSGGAETAPTPEDLERDAIDRLIGMIRAGRSGRTYVLTLSVMSRDPEKAAQIANALMRAYTDDQLNFRLGSIDRSADWLKARAAELRRQSLDADRAVQAYRSANGIVDTQRGIVQEQQLSELNTQLATIRAQVAEKKARLERATSLGPNGIPDATFTEALANPVIVKLREQYLDVSRREADLRQRYGESHPAVVSLRNNMDELRRSVQDELDRIIESFKSDYRNAKASQDEIERNIARLIEQAGQTNRERVELRALETTAQTYRTLFETFLQQYATTLQQQSFPVLSARVITPAKAPKRKSHPRTMLILLGSVVAGLGFGWLLGYGRETMRPVVRGEREFEQLTGLAPLGQLPDIAYRRRLFGKAARHSFQLDGLRLVGSRDPLLQITRLYPHSWFSNTVKHVQHALDADQGRQSGRVVGIVSAQSGEGKTVLAANLAQHLAKTGALTLLLDLDFRNPSLTAATECAPSDNFVDTVSDEARLHAAMIVDDDTGLCFVPNGGAPRDHDPTSALTSPALQTFITLARSRFDYIVLDLPAFDSVIDARFVSMFADSFIVVGACHRTQSRALTDALDQWETAGLMPAIGFVLNRVRTRDRLRMRQTQVTRAAFAGFADRARPAKLRSVS